jgi:TolA-binding protein
MAEEKATQKGGFHFGNVGGDVDMDAGGDIVAGDKTTTTTTTTTTTITYGFKQEEDKAEFLKQIDELRTMMRQIRSEIDDLEGVDDDEKDDLVMEIGQQVKDLKTVKEEAEETTAGEEAPKEKAKLVGEYLDKTTTIMEKLKKMGEATAAATEKLAPYVVKALPLLASVRHLFGLP